MSVPNEADFAIIKMGDGEIVETFTTLCHMESVSLNENATMTERMRRDCQKPGSPAVRRLRSTGKTLTVSASGAFDKLDIAKYEAALGIIRNYQIELYKEDGTDLGTLYGETTGAFMLTSRNMTVVAGGDSSGEITLENDGAWVWTPAA